MLKVHAKIEHDVFDLSPDGPSCGSTVEQRAYVHIPNRDLEARCTCMHVCKTIGVL